MEHPLYPSDADPEQICIAGDWHGNTWWAMQMLERVAGRARVILHAGDWGLWRESPSMNKYVSRQNRLLTAGDSYLIVTPGNHENWNRLGSLPIDPDFGLQKLTNRIWFAPRGYRWQWGETAWMSLGGAVSVDRHWRREGRDWWAAEAMTDADAELAIAGGPVGAMITHDAPAGARIPGLTPDEWPADAIADSDRHQALLRRVVDRCRPMQLWHGHMHVAYGDQIDLGWQSDRPGWDGMLRVHGLDCDTGAWQDNLALARPDGTPRAWDIDDATVR